MRHIEIAVEDSNGHIYYHQVVVDFNTPTPVITVDLSQYDDTKDVSLVDVRQTG